MSQRKRTFRAVAVSAAASAAVVLLLAWPVRSSLTIAEEPAGRLVFAEPAGTGDSFAIRFIHSVHRTPVEELYRIAANGDMVLERVVYESYGVGNPSQAEPGQSFRIEDGKLIIERFDRRFDVIRLRVGQKVADHELIAFGRAIPLAELAEPGTRVRIEIRKLSVWSLLTRQRGGHHDEYK